MRSGYRPRLWTRLFEIEIPIVWNEQVGAGEPNLRELEPDREVAEA
jgi:hypothetical protein